MAEAIVSPPPAAAVPAASALRADASERNAFLRWLLCWVILPNLPFLPVSLMGGPPRYPEILACAVAGLVVRRAPAWLRSGVFLAMIGWMVATFIARMFNMHVSMLLSVVGLVADIRPAVSPEYVGGAALLAAASGAAFWLLRRPQAFSRPALVFWATGAMFSLAAADWALSRHAIGSYSRLAPAGAPFSSAVKQSGFATLADGRTNLMIVVVEAMGQPTDPGLRERFDRIWNRPELAGRYEIVRGDTPFYGSTTSGEMRELCGRWGDYHELDAPQPGCLPATLARKGYATSAYHAFKADFFERDRWYPLLGFETMKFGDDLLKQGAALCPNVFPGACDRDIPAIIARDVKAAKGPQFTYWLTLNSHLPVVANRELGTRDCKRLGREMDADFPMVCRLFAIWSNTADALVRTVQRPDFPPTHILIVGDHMPPFTHQESRLKFDPAHVPWIMLRYRGEPSPAPAQAPAQAPSQASPR